MVSLSSALPYPCVDFNSCALAQIESMDFSSSSSPLQLNPEWIYDVFINFRSKDTGKSFVSHLYAVLKKARIKHIDIDQLHDGVLLESELFEAIKMSRMSILVFSKNYTESSWCLDELQKVMECRRTHGQMVVPVFYDVTSSDVRYQKGHFGKKLRVAAKRISGKGMREHVVSGWRVALSEAANIVGWDASNFR